MTSDSRVSSGAGLSYTPPNPPVAENELQGVWRRTAFFVNPTAGSPVGGAKEILAGATSAGVTLAAFNVGDGGSWRGWSYPLETYWARCDSDARADLLDEDDIANIESPEMASGFMTPQNAFDIVGPGGAAITEGVCPHADWTPFDGSPVFLEVDLNVPQIKDILETQGVQHLVDYAHTLGVDVPVPCFFMVPAAGWWDGEPATFATYFDRLREQWPHDFGLYNAEAIPDWRVVK